MCILRYLPAMLPSVSSTTAVLWYRPAARRSNREATSTTPCRFASAPSRSVVGPGMVSARSNSCTDSCWQKYGPLCSSCSSTSLAPPAAASATRASIAARLAASLPWSISCTSATRRVRGGSARLVDITGSLGNLHGHAMQAAVLPDQRAAGHLHDVPAREGLGQHRRGARVGRVAVGRHQHGAIDDQEVGVGRREPPFAVGAAVQDRLRPW